MLALMFFFLIYAMLINILVLFYNMLFHTTFKQKKIRINIFQGNLFVQNVLRICLQLLSRRYFRTSNCLNILDKSTG